MRKRERSKEEEMMIKTAIEILENEIECVKSAESCDRDCGNCDLVKDADEIIAAEKIAVMVLKRQACLSGAYYDVQV